MSAAWQQAIAAIAAAVLPVLVKLVSDWRAGLGAGPHIASSIPVDGPVLNIGGDSPAEGEG